MDETPWLSTQQQCLWRRWLAINSLLPAELHRELQADAGLSLPDFEVLVLLSEGTRCRVRLTDLARDLSWEKSRASHHVTRMERRGLLAREECSDDGRGSFVVMTTDGRAAIERAAPGHARAVRSLVFDQLTQGEMETLDGVLGKVLGRLEARQAGVEIV